MKKRTILFLLPLFLCTGCGGKVVYNVDSKYAPYYSLSLSLNETKVLESVSVTTDQKVLEEKK